MEVVTILKLPERLRRRTISLNAFSQYPWILCLILSFMAPVAPAWAGEWLHAGAHELALKGGYSIRHDTDQSYAPGRNMEGIHLLPHYGYTLTNEKGAGWIRGNLSLLLEPTLIRLDHEQTRDLYGVAVLGRWMLSRWDAVRPYLEGGGGILFGRPGLRGRSDCNTNFVLQGGPGILIRTSEREAFTVGYRFHHISNSDICDDSDANRGIDSSLFLIGVSYFLNN